MKKPAIYQYLTIDFYSATPRYIQLANCIVKAITAGKVRQNDMLPSINELSAEFEISRDTVEKCFKYLKKKGIVGSVAGKGYFIQSIEVKEQYKVFMLFNKLSLHKKIIYDAFAEAMGTHALIDLYIYHNDFDLFTRLIQNRKADYTHYVVIPYYTKGEENTAEVLQSLPANKLIILDKLVPGFGGACGAVYERFDTDLYNALENALPQLQKYHTLHLLFPEDTYHPQEILRGFKLFCRHYTFTYEVITHISELQIAPGHVYINLMEDDLVVLIEKIMAQQLEVGRQVGVISYNETPLKKIILNGITTISTDFAQMGQTAAQLVKTSSTDRIANPFRLTLRASL